MRNHGTDPGAASALMRERIEAMKEIWTADEAAYHGRHVDFDPIWSWPKPLQQPHPPVILGGNADGALDRAVAVADGWIPNPRRASARSASGSPSSSAAPTPPGRDRCRSPSTPSSPRPRRCGATRRPAWTARCSSLPQAGRDVVEPLVDAFATLAHEHARG